ncbi:CHAD domain-containing protein [Pseudomonas sp. LB1P83]
MDDTGFDRHELRILVKRTRYLTEAFPKLSPLSCKAASSLKALQSALGSWHDHYQWCQKASTDSDLRPLEKAEARLADLATLLPKLSGKKNCLERQQKNSRC